MRITLGFWSVDENKKEIKREFNNFMALFMFLAPFIRDQEKGFYSISFSITGEKT